MRQKSVLLVDGYSLIHRGFHALPLLSANGVYTNAVQGFFSMLFRAVGEYRPDALLVMMDVHAPTFRHTMYDAYKAGRKPTPPELRPQFDLTRELLAAMGVTVCELAGYEADDLLGTVARQANEQGWHAYVLTGDRDSLQLVGPDTQLILTKTGVSESLLLGPDEVLSVYGYTPAQVPDMKGLMGDSSDNIPGVPGVGEKTALKLIQQYGTLENVLAHAAEQKGKLGEKLAQYREQAVLSKELGTIRRTAPVRPDLAACTLQGMPGGVDALRGYQLNRLAQQLATLFDLNTDAPEAAQARSAYQSAVREQAREAAPAEADSTRRTAAGKRAGGDAARSAALPVDPADALEADFPPRRMQPPLTTEADVAALAERLAREATPVPESVRAVLALRAEGFGVPGADGDAGEPDEDDPAAPIALYASPEAVSLCLPDGATYVVPLLVDLTRGGLPEETVYRALAPLLAARPLVLHGAKALWRALARLGLPRPAAYMDALLSGYLLSPNQKSFALPAPEGGAADAHTLYQTALTHRMRLHAKGMLALLTRLEQPLTRALFDMEQYGFTVDAGVLAALGKTFAEECAAARDEVYRLTGASDFNLNSPRQLAEVLFDTLGLPSGKKGKAGARSVDAEVLEGLLPLHPAIEPLLAYRKLTKLTGTYIEGLQRLTDASGRVHTTFDQTAAVTGRISSLEPNLQNIPVRSEQGREIRRAFVARPGCTLLDADYSQIELRVLAHLSGDPAMRDAFLRGQDIHARTAAEVAGVPIGSVTPDMRRRAKAVNFGIVYGISGFGLAKNIGVGRKEADEFIRQYFARYPDVKRFMDECVRLGYENGYVETLFGRRRALPELSSLNRNVRSFGERAAMNTPVQGSAADIIKLAMVRVHQALLSGGYEARLILQVHDELVVECPFAEVEAASRLLRDCMQNVVSLAVPLVADVGVGESWYEAKA